MLSIQMTWYHSQRGRFWPHIFVTHFFFDGIRRDMAEVDRMIAGAKGMRMPRTMEIVRTKRRTRDSRAEVSDAEAVCDWKGGASRTGGTGAHTARRGETAGHLAML